MTVGITRHELGAGDLRREARRCRDGAASRRMLALALVLEGVACGRFSKLALGRAVMAGWRCLTSPTPRSPAMTVAQAKLSVAAKELLKGNPDGLREVVRAVLQ